MSAPQGNESQDWPKDDTRLQMLWEYYRDNRAHALTFHQQRHAFAGIIGSLSIGIIGYLSVHELSVSTIPMGVFIIVLGSFGVFEMRRFYGLSERYFERSRECLCHIQDITGEKIFDKIKQHADKKTEALSSWRMHQLWICGFVLIIGFGFAVTV